MIVIQTIYKLYDIFFLRSERENGGPSERHYKHSTASWVVKILERKTSDSFEKGTIYLLCYIFCSNIHLGFIVHTFC